MAPRKDSLDPSSPALGKTGNNSLFRITKSFKNGSDLVPSPTQYPAVPTSPIVDPYEHVPQNYHVGPAVNRFPSIRALPEYVIGRDLIGTPDLTHGSSPLPAFAQSSPVGFAQPARYVQHQNVVFNSEPDHRIIQHASPVPVHVGYVPVSARKVNGHVQYASPTKSKVDVPNEEEKGDMVTVPFHRVAITALSKAPPENTGWELPIYMTPQEMLTFFPQETNTFWAASRLCQYQWSVKEVADFIAISRGIPDKKGLRAIIEQRFNQVFTEWSGRRDITYNDVLTRRVPLPPGLLLGPDIEHRANPRLCTLAVGVRVWPTGDGAKLLTKLVRHVVKHELSCRVSELKTMAKTLGWFNTEMEKEWQKLGSGMIGWMKAEGRE